MKNINFLFLLNFILKLLKLIPLFLFFVIYIIIEYNHNINIILFYSNII